MITVLILLTVFGAILLVLTILIQPGKAEMISGMGGLGGQVSNLLGVRGSRNFLQNLTIGLIAGIMLMAIIINKVFLPSAESTIRTPVTTGAEVPAGSVPGTPAPIGQPTQQPPTQQPPSQQPPK
ncbi:MAG: preprotein translocase subunit SecG [Ignavibacteria bacterium]|nr:preprotein translocase subunit SecG [Ignavibacteria bacterium]